MTYPVNLCIPLFDEADDLSVIADGAITGGRFIEISATYSEGPALNTSDAGGRVHVNVASAGGTTFGVSEHDMASGQSGGIIRKGVVPMTADGSITAGGEVMVGSAGKAKAATTTHRVTGKALNTVTDGQTVYVALAMNGPLI